jgi:hypothetical protein
LCTCTNQFGGFGSRQDSHLNHSASASEGVSRVVDGVEVGSKLDHGVKTALDGSDVLEVLDILRLDNISHEALDSLVVLHPLVNKRLGQVLLGLRRRGHGLDSRLAAVGSLGLRSLSLALTSLGGLSRSSCRRAARASVVIVDTLHVVT